jgi:Mrp family chromosome partitioning ATPase
VLRTNVEFSTLEKPAQTFLVTSANPGEGKTTTVANLALVLAQAGKLVIAVDSDLRRRLPAMAWKQDRLTNLLLSQDGEMNGCVEPRSRISGAPSGLSRPTVRLLGSRRLEAILRPSSNLRMSSSWTAAGAGGADTSGAIVPPCW